MKLYYNRKSKDPIYYVQQSVRIGEKTTTRNIRRIGKHSELLEITDDPIGYAREIVRQMNEEQRIGEKKIAQLVNYGKSVEKTDDIVSVSTHVNIGYFFLQYIMKDLHLKDFFAEKAENSKAALNCYDINRFLVYDSMLSLGYGPDSYNTLPAYYEKTDDNYQQISEYMDIMAENFDDYLVWLYEKSNNIIKRDTSYLFCYFTDIGISLCMDSMAVPVTMFLPAGIEDRNDTDKLHGEEVLNLMPEAEVVFCTDTGTATREMKNPHGMADQMFVAAEPAADSVKAIQKEIYEESNYRLVSDDKPVSLAYMLNFDRSDKKNEEMYDDFAYKIIKNRGTGYSSDKRIIIMCSRKLRNTRRALRNQNVGAADFFLKTKNPDLIESAPDHVRQYIMKSAGDDSVYFPDLIKIRNEELYDGFFTVITNLENSVQEIMQILINKQRTEDFFRKIMLFPNKLYLHPNFDKITKVSFLICYTAFLVYQLLRTELEAQEIYFAGDDIAETLRNINVCDTGDIFYMATYKGSRVLSALTDLTSLQLDKFYYKTKDLDKMIKKMLQ